MPSTGSWSCLDRVTRPRDETALSRGLDALATGAAAATVVDGFCSLRLMVSSSCSFCSTGVMLDHLGMFQLYADPRCA
jgi:hypothetical protein